MEAEFLNNAGSGTCLIDAPPPSDSDCLAGQKVCVIGRFLAMTQADVVEVVRSHGGAVVQIPAEDALVVVGGDGWPCQRDGSPTPLAARVQELRHGDPPIEILSEEELFARLGLVEARRSICRELTAAELGRVLGLRAVQIRRWARLGLRGNPVRTVHRLAFFDLAQVASAKRICELVGRGASLANIRRGLEQIVRWLPEREAPLSQLALLEHDGRILVRLNGTLAEPSGQLRFNFDPPGELSALKGARNDAREDSESLFDRALAAEDSQDFRAADELYRQAILRDPADPVLHFNRGNVLFSLSRYADAADSFQRALRCDSGYAEAWNNLGNTFAQLESWHAALAAFRRALQLVPNYDDAQYNLDRVIRRMPMRRMSMAE